MKGLKKGDKATLLHINFAGVGSTPHQLVGTEVTICEDRGDGYIYRNAGVSRIMWWAPYECFWSKHKDCFARPEPKTVRRMNGSF